MRKFYLLILLVIDCMVLPSCWYAQNVPYKYQKEFNQCYDGNYTGLDTIINIDGYFKEIEISKRSFSSYDEDQNENSRINRIDTNETLMMFFKDGTFVYEIVGFNTCEEEELFFNDIVNNPKRQKTFSNGYSWGIYKIKNDSLSICCIDHIKFGWNPWILIQFNYKILNKSTLGLRNYDYYYADEIVRMVHKQRNFGEINYYVIHNDTTFVYPAKFIPLKSIPNSDCWLKKEKWFWCDENEWRNYMETNGFKIRHKDRLKK